MCGNIMHLVNVRYNYTNQHLLKKVWGSNLLWVVEYVTANNFILLSLLACADGTSLDSTVLWRQFAMVNANWPTAVTGEADSVSSLSDSASHIGWPIGVNPGKSALVYGKSIHLRRQLSLWRFQSWKIIAHVVNCVIQYTFSNVDCIIWHCVFQE